MPAIGYHASHEQRAFIATFGERVLPDLAGS
jgi:hypothetical protein